MNLKVTGTIALLETGFLRGLIPEDKPIKKRLIELNFHANSELLNRLPD